MTTEKFQVQTLTENQNLLAMHIKLILAICTYPAGDWQNHRGAGYPFKDKSIL